jgi:hypothetical protein
MEPLHNHDETALDHSRFWLDRRSTITPTRHNHGRRQVITPPLFPNYLFVRIGGYLALDEKPLFGRATRSALPVGS